MRIEEGLHCWGLSFASARALQSELAARVETGRPLGPWTTIAAADVSHNRRETRLYAAVVATRGETLEEIDRSVAVQDATFPYVPGLLSFREAPVVLEAFRGLRVRPDVVLCDGQGRAHPRRLGLACHLGLWLGVPTIGCAKSRLHGDHEPPGPTRGDCALLRDHEETIGAVVRTRSGVRPLYVSVGHLCDLESAIQVVLATSPRYRVPVPLRLAHQVVNEQRRADSGSGQDPVAARRG